MSDELTGSAQRVQEALGALNFSFQITQFPASTKTAQEAANAIGCTVGQIAKSLIFRGTASGRAILVIASGSNRVNESRLGELAGELVEKPDADFVRTHTGFAIGGIPPLAHAEKLLTFIDKDLLQYSEIWAAAGTPNSVFKLTPADLQKMADGEVTQIT